MKPMMKTPLSLIAFARPLFAFARPLFAFTRHSVARFAADGCLSGAGALAYGTLVSMVPLTAIALAVLSATPIFASIRDELLTSLFQSFVPEVGKEVEWWFRYLAGTSVRTTTIGILALAVTSILLLAEIEDQLHRIWRTRAKRPFVQRLLAYWAILTLGPLLLGASFSLPGYVELAASRTGLGATVALFDARLHRLALILPPLLETLAFTLIYALIPNRAVRWREALLGAVIAAFLVEVLKVGFAAYINHFSTYRAVYGALAALPIFLLWMYLAWASVLFGAEVAASLPRWRVDEHAAAAPAVQRLGLALALLYELALGRASGFATGTAPLAKALRVATTAVDDTLAQLQRAGFVAATADGGWVLSRDLREPTLLDLYRALALPIVGAWHEGDGHPWTAPIAGALNRVAAAETQALGMPLAELLDIP